MLAAGLTGAIAPHIELFIPKKERTCAPMIGTQAAIIGQQKQLQAAHIHLENSTTWSRKTATQASKNKLI